jgi:methylenetetrahydrofolate dehydrogenase (NADP+)/methenyltetrahydrofolate cyclohydrolase
MEGEYIMAVTGLEPKLLKGKPLADEILAQVAAEAESLKAQGVYPCLTTIEVGEDPASRYYLENQKRVAERVGIKYELRQLDPAISRLEMLKVIEDINQDSSIHGLIINLPLPKHLNTSEMQWSISGLKDVEGITPYNMGRLFMGTGGLQPCTAVAIVELVKASGIDIKGKEATIVGRSNIVGKPAGIMLMAENATVTTCHSFTSKAGKLEKHVNNADILVAAIGVPELIKGDWIKPGAVVIDAGINSVNGKMVGDVEFEAAKEKAAWITPVPGGVGTVTTAILMKNTIEAARAQGDGSSVSS